MHTLSIMVSYIERFNCILAFFRLDAVPGYTMVFKDFNTVIISHLNLDNYQ